MDRRGLLSGLALALAGPGISRALEFEPAPLPPGIDPEAAPGLSWAGAGPAAIEIFDYNCPYCRAIFQTLDARVAKNRLRLGLIDSPQLSIGSIQAAKLRQAALKLHGPVKAYAFHRQMFAQRGAIDGESGLKAAQALQFDVAQLIETADSDQTRDILVGAAHFLNKAGVRATPSFFLGGKLLTGWPGPQGFDAILKKAA
ncbi:DsbA family protein [uncultured Rhodoblastus sp.]|uniref:DsbA family protein n=1 Tax=uncultured Rhodoblastus sp. TaxID=543037 RepID=UPI00260050CB|nr:DsbA family protein [uncultured Rhodoblastus sp.]